MWWLEALIVRTGFSVYSGWVTGATVLNTAYMLKSMGMTDNMQLVRQNWTWAEPLMFLTEEQWTIVALWTVEIFNEVVAWWERNPVWGAVFAWANGAILAKNIDLKPDKF